jgi:sacsin
MCFVDEKETIIQLMKQNNIDLVDVPDHVTSVMQDRNIPVQTLTPDFIVKCLKSNSSYTLLTLEDKMNVYNYLVSDGEFSRLHGLELLPINNGTFAVFGNRNFIYDNQVIICKDDIDLFPGQDEKFVCQDLQDKIYDSILEIAKKGKKKCYYCFKL